MDLVNESQKPKTQPKILRVMYFWSGIIATLAYRIIIVLTNVDTFWIKLSWYIGTIGFVIYFIHRYEISQKREKIIENQKLISKVEKLENFDQNDKEGLLYILKSLRISTERFNYIFIFVTSALALIVGIYLDFIK